MSSVSPEKTVTLASLAIFLGDEAFFYKAGSNYHIYGVTLTVLALLSLFIPYTISHIVNAEKLTSCFFKFGGWVSFPAGLGAYYFLRKRDHFYDGILSLEDINEVLNKQTDCGMAKYSDYKEYKKTEIRRKVQLADKIIRANYSNPDQNS